VGSNHYEQNMILYSAFN